MRPVDHGHRIAIHAEALHVSDDADYRPPRFAIARPDAWRWGPDPGTSAAQRLVDHHAAGARHVRIGEEPAWRSVMPAARK